MSAMRKAANLSVRADLLEEARATRSITSKRRNQFDAEWSGPCNDVICKMVER